MIYRALKSFSGRIAMHRGEEKEITDKKVISDLLAVGFIEEVKPQKKEKQKEKE